MIYCVVPGELAADWHEDLVEHFRDVANVSVIADRRTGPDRRSSRSGGGRRQRRDRRRARIPGTFLPTDPPPSA